MAEGVNYTHIHDLGVQYVQHQPEPGMATGFKDIDAWMGGGLVKQRIYVIAGRTREGKSSFALSIARRMAFDDARKVLYLSLEMTKMELTMRLMAQATLTPLVQLEALRASGQLAEKVEPVLEAAEKAWLHIEDSRGALVDDLNGMLMDMAPEVPDVIVIDHLQRVRLDYGTTKADAIDQYLGELSEFAKRKSIAIVLCCQINRTGDESPQLIHLKSSGAIEEIADVVMICNRVGYESTSSPSTEVKDYDYEVWVAKHRQGMEYKFNLLFRAACFEFLNPAAYSIPKLPHETVVIDD